MICNGLLQRVFRPFMLAATILLIFLLCAPRIFAQAPSREREKAIRAQELLQNVDGAALVANPGMRSVLFLELANSYQAIDVSRVPAYLTRPLKPPRPLLTTKIRSRGCKSRLLPGC